MKNADMPAMPTPVMDNGSTSHGTEPTYGLTKREVFAMHAMQGLLAANSGWRQFNQMTNDVIVSEAVELADALLAELDKSKGDAK